jgi:hypothetical protein
MEGPLGEDNIKAVRDDLAFMRTLAEGGSGGMGRPGSALYTAAGLIYGLQCLGHYAQAIGLLTLGKVGSLVLGLGPTVLFLVLMVGVIILDRRMPAGGVANRAVNAAFAGVGIANLTIAWIFAAAASSHHDFRYWLFHPAVVFTLQGAAWYVVFMLRRRPWMLVTAAGWLGTGLALGLLIDAPVTYTLVAALGLFAWMMVPGLVMMRQSWPRA